MDILLITEIFERLNNIKYQKTEIKNAIITKKQMVDEILADYAPAILRIEDCSERKIYDDEALSFLKLDEGEGFVSLNLMSGNTDKTYLYKFNENNWADYTLNTEIQLKQNDKVSFISYDELAVCSNMWRVLFKTGEGIYDCGGRINSLTNNKDVMFDYMFSGLFKGTNIIKIPVLSAMTLTDFCYDSMFANCTNLEVAPELPATTLATLCYYNMFANCTSLEVAPELPATTLATSCYEYMFNGCSSLTTAPVLPAKTMKNYCYHLMFFLCSSLTTAPELPATTLATSCYEYMFAECSSLTTAPELPATTLTAKCYKYMFMNCYNLISAPELPATTLASSCYAYMFEQCYSLTTAPELPATTLAEKCYERMFENCSNLTTAPELHVDTLTTGEEYNRMFLGCSNLKTIYCNARYIKDTEITTKISTDWLLNIPNTSDCKFYKNSQWKGPTTRSNNTIPSNWQILNWYN